MRRSLKLKSRMCISACMQRLEAPASDMCMRIRGRSTPNFTQDLTRVAEKRRRRAPVCSFREQRVLPLLSRNIQSMCMQNLNRHTVT